MRTWVVVTRWVRWVAGALAVGLVMTATPRFLVAQEGLPGRDIRSWATADVSSILSLAGEWAPSDKVGNGVQFIGPYYTAVRLGAEQRQGIALGGWVFNGSFTSTLTDNDPVQAGLFAQQADGTLLESSRALLGETGTKGVGSVIAGDFNGDGRQDVFYSAHNESPFYFQHSVAYMSQPDGSLRRVDVPDTVMNHSAQLYRVNGQDKVIANSFGGSGNNGNGPGAVNLYAWNGTNFTITRLAGASMMTVAAGAFTADEREWVVTGEQSSGPGVAFSATLPPLHYSYRISNNLTLRNLLLSPPGDLPKPYFNDKPEYAAFESFRDGQGSKTHTIRMLTSDLNQDGLLDAVAVSTIWADRIDGFQRTALQLLFNTGEMRFTDVTDALPTEFNQESVPDRDTNLRDVDGSGIATAFTASNVQATGTNDAGRQGNYILVNDGTGRLHVAMHDEFRAMASQVTTFLRSRTSAGYGPNTSITPQFIAYQTPEGTLNFAAVVRLFAQGQPRRFGVVNVPLGINLTTDFRRDLAIPGRNGSRRIRTFAGNNTIARALMDPDCTIDGGLGTNVVVYPGSMRDWSLQRQGATVLISHRSGTGGTDRLTRIQVARFNDGDVPLAE